MNVAEVRRLARYNAWANNRLYEACASLSPADYRAPRASFFGSIHATLNHILVGDRIWMGRFEQRPSDLTRLDMILHDDFAELRAARSAEDARVLGYARALDDEALSTALRYRTTSGEARELPLAWAVTHFFNHQTHHRGQTHAMLSGTPVPPPPLDLLYFFPEDRD